MCHNYDLSQNFFNLAQHTLSLKLSLFWFTFSYIVTKHWFSTCVAFSWPTLSLFRCCCCSGSCSWLQCILLFSYNIKQNNICLLDNVNETEKLLPEKFAHYVIYIDQETDFIFLFTTSGQVLIIIEYKFQFLTIIKLFIF